MPNLGDYLGNLISEVTLARMQADIEAVRIAELYSSHPLLKNMPIPHFRLPAKKVRLSATQSKSLKKALDRKVVSLTQPKEVSVDVNRVAKEFSNAIVESLADSKLDAKSKEGLENKIYDLARVEFLNLRKEPSRLQVLVNTSQIREAGPTETITKLHLRITEEAFEWTSIDLDGKKEDRLVIE
ncbi:MAG: hypothetical protein P8X84_06440 [Candidatus Bathyarchaeota archaeon]